MIRQFFVNTNKSATILILPKILELNKPQKFPFKDQLAAEGDMALFLTD